jgi:hypothetical protein
MVWENYRSEADENGKDRESMLCYRKMREQGIL